MTLKAIHTTGERFTRRHARHRRLDPGAKAGRWKVRRVHRVHSGRFQHPNGDPTAHLTRLVVSGPSNEIEPGDELVYAETLNRSERGAREWEQRARSAEAELERLKQAAQRAFVPSGPDDDPDPAELQARSEWHDPDQPAMAAGEERQRQAAAAEQSAR
jgi:uncharacterized protein YciI